MISESIKYGWQKFKDNIGISIFAVILTGLVSVIQGGRGLTRFILWLLGMILTVIVSAGYNKLFLRMSDGEKPNFGDIFKEYPLFWKYLGISIILPIVVLVGFILVIIPGIIWSVRFAFAPLIVVDTKASPIAAMKESWAITKGNFWSLIGFWIVMVLVNVLGFIVVGVGLLVSVPVTTFASVYVYRKLTAARASLDLTPQAI